MKNYHTFFLAVNETGQLIRFIHLDKDKYLAEDVYRWIDGPYFKCVIVLMNSITPLDRMVAVFDRTSRSFKDVYVPASEPR